MPPVASSHSRASVVDSGIAPATEYRIDDRSAPVSFARAKMRSNMGGTPTKKVTGRRACASRAICASNLGSSTWVAALRTAAHRKNVRPKAWK